MREDEMLETAKWLWIIAGCALAVGLLSTVGEYFGLI